MRRKASTLSTGGGTLAPERGMRLRIQDGEFTEDVRVLAVNGTEVTVGRWRWHHAAASWVRGRVHAACEALSGLVR